MKKGFYIRYVPWFREQRYYLYRNGMLMVLTDSLFDSASKWRKSCRLEPTKKLGFEYVCNLEMEF